MNADEVRPRQQEAIVRKRLTAMQRQALAHPMTESDKRPDPARIWHAPTEDQSKVLTCDIDDQTVAVFGGPVWHASVCPPIRRQAKKLMAGVGEGVLFEEPGVRPDIYHLRRRMAREEIELLGGGYAQ
jgi:hypothetical protein